MRHPRFLTRALAHPSQGALPRRVAPPSAGGTARPAPRPEEVPDDPDDAGRLARSQASAALLTAAGVLGAMCAGSVIAGQGTPRITLAVVALLTVAGVLVRRPGEAQRALAAVMGVALLPALLVIALAVRLSGPGPVLVREARHGTDGRPYRALRFRTTRQPTTPDARTTAVGRLLQALSLDELPSLLDMARGRLQMPGMHHR